MAIILEFAKRMSNMTTIKDVAKVFLNIESMSPKKLQKMCFYTYSWYLTYYNKKLFTNQFEAWIHGPVDPSLYQEYREFGYSNIPKESVVPESVTANPQLYEFIEAVYKSYGHLTADQLEYLTHSQTPWENARGSLQPFQSSSNLISDEDIVAYHYWELENAKKH